MNCTGIILSGGQNSRFGSDKGLATFKGKTLIQIAVNTLNEICSDIIISSNSGSYDSLGFRVVSDKVKGIGPMAGIYSCLLESKTDDNFVLSVDSPMIPSALFRYIYKNRNSNVIAVPWFGQLKYEPLIGYYNREVLPAMRQYIGLGGDKLPDLFEKVPFKKIIVNESLYCYQKHMFFNINTPEDLEILSNIEK